MSKHLRSAKLNPVLSGLHQSVTENFKRPNHPDFMTSAELKNSGWSGMRDHKMAMEYEIWIVGEMVKSVSYMEVAKDPFALTKAYMEYFGVA